MGNGRRGGNVCIEVPELIKGRYKNAKMLDRMAKRSFFRIDQQWAGSGNIRKIAKIINQRLIAARLSFCIVIQKN